jgi:hypothetical protein
MCLLQKAVFLASRDPLAYARDRPMDLIPGDAIIRMRFSRSLLALG